MFCDYIVWKCDLGDCPHDWHLGRLFFEDEGVFWDPYGDGDAELVDEPVEQDEETLTAYYQYCRDSGFDPLDLFMVPNESETRQRWECQWSKVSDGGACLMAARRGSQEWVSGNDPALPADLVSYLCLTDGGFFDSQWNPGFGFDELIHYAGEDDNVTGFRVYDDDGRPRLRFKVTIPIRELRPESAYKRDVRRAAARALAGQGR